MHTFCVFWSSPTVADVLKPSLVKLSRFFPSAAVPSLCQLLPPPTHKYTYAPFTRPVSHRADTGALVCQYTQVSEGPFECTSPGLWFPSFRPLAFLSTSARLVNPAGFTSSVPLYDLPDQQFGLTLAVYPTPPRVFSDCASLFLYGDFL